MRTKTATLESTELQLHCLFVCLSHKMHCVSYQSSKCLPIKVSGGIICLSILYHCFVLCARITVSLVNLPSVYKLNFQVGNISIFYPCVVLCARITVSLVAKMAKLLCNQTHCSCSREDHLAKIECFLWLIIGPPG